MFISYRTSYAAEGEAARRRGMEDYFDVKNRQRKQGFAAAAGLLKIGHSLWDTYSSNKELIEFARQEGYKTKTDMFTNIFGTPSFTDPYGKTMSAMDMYGLQFYRDYKKTKDIVNLYTEEGQ